MGAKKKIWKEGEGPFRDAQLTIDKYHQLIQRHSVKGMQIKNNEKLQHAEFVSINDLHEITSVVLKHGFNIAVDGATPGSEFNREQVAKAIKKIIRGQ